MSEEKQIIYIKHNDVTKKVYYLVRNNQEGKVVSVSCDMLDAERELFLQDALARL